MLWYFMLAFSTHNSSFDFTNNQFYTGMYIKKGYKPKLNPKYVQLDCCMVGIALEYQLFQFLQALLYCTLL